ncbi:uncharacterized protein EV422DRAFT_68649 [Fimicolochytrium jonesii]|uniref:uncharacterized protein n=1 Tax=Fimicolochytrium jonesii TaxID=1396493 RepID=UPI0022FDE2EE|nr:uncharacterized protein EV422DRAFT_68649 [Fimicolochytrium jonesii]KAI8820388.1 hypothetical protein EV422DRAFT_68649 [Fimicolochytrium jonesii]
MLILIPLSTSTILLLLLTLSLPTSATVTPILTTTFQPATNVPSVQNIDFPLHTHTYNATSFLNTAIFHPADSPLGPCRIKTYNVTYLPDPITGAVVPVLDPTTGMDPVIGFFDVRDLLAAGCGRYGAVAWANGWHQTCPNGTSIAELLATPGILPCSAPSTRPQVALYMQLGPVHKQCCPDPVFARASSWYGFTYEVSHQCSSKSEPKGHDLCESQYAP